MKREIIAIRHLKKSFGDVKAVDDLSFSVKEGELFAFLGLNGAGKSTTISILCGQLPRDGGEVLVDGLDTAREIDAVKSKLGVVFQNSVLDRVLSVSDNLRFRAALYGITGDAFKTRLDELDSLLGLSKLLKRTVGKLSGGERRRIDIARALLHRPKLLILDEPTTGLDPQTRKTVWATVDTLRNEGVTVLLTTHYMEEAAEADNVVIIDSGRLVASGTPQELKNHYTGDYITLYDASEQELSALGLAFETRGTAKRVAVENTAEATSLILAHPELFRDYEITKGNMDDVFLNATGKQLSGDNL